jgi:transposase, IS30 family
MSYEQLNLYDRKLINKKLFLKKSFNQIALELKRSVSTISNEVNRNKGRYWYNPYIAQKKYEERRKNSKLRIIDKNIELKDYIIKELKDGKSPDAISGRLKLTHKKNPLMQISHESIYCWIYDEVVKGSDLHKHLIRCARKRKKRLNKYKSRMKIPERVSIHKRPEAVESRRYRGHWEGDTIVGKGHSGYIATLVERKSYLLAAGYMPNKKPETCNRAILEGVWNILNKDIKTITFDNGTEFYHHYILKDALECKTYFADPYSSWQRGINEHTNGILRRFFPKNMNFSEVTQKDVDEAVEKINNTPRKSLGYKTPYEVFYNLSVSVQP